MNEDNTKYAILILLVEDNGVVEDLVVGSADLIDRVYDLDYERARDMFEDLVFEARNF